MMAAIPAPPPLPPKSSFNPDDLNASTRDNTQLPDPEAQVEKWCQSLKANYRSGIYCLTPARPVIQDGPTCGLVALSMAVDSLGLKSSVPDILSEAQKRGFTKHGEMMNAHNMKCLSEQMFPVTAVLDKGLRRNVLSVLDHLANGWPIILSYDCDANHAPIVKNGRRAHWAVILGFAFMSHNEIADQSQMLTRFATPMSSEEVRNMLSHSEIDDLYLIARQGKSKFMHMWMFDDLCYSNENLLQVCDKLNGLSHVLPEGGLSESLADQFILIKPDPDAEKGCS